VSVEEEEEGTFV